MVRRRADRVRQPLRQRVICGAPRQCRGAFCATYRNYQTAAHAAGGMCMSRGIGVELKDLWIRFDDFVAVRNANVAVEGGKFFSFLGPSGCGKTTILRAVSGFLDPSEGDILIGGNSMRGIGPNKRPTAPDISEPRAVSADEGVGKHRLFDGNHRRQCQGAPQACGRAAGHDRAVRSGPTNCPPSYLAASASASPSPARYAPSRTSCYWTSRCRRWT